MIFLTIILASQINKIITKLSLKKFVPIKKGIVDFSYAATDNINALFGVDRTD
jgi:hypothetical protein